MKTDPGDPRTRLLEATIALIGEEADPRTITVRQIAEKAAVGTGLLNYHFGSKENLLNEAMGTLMNRNAELDSAEKWSAAGGAPRERVKRLLKQTSQVALRFPTLAPLLSRSALLGGDYGPERALLPLLREHFGPTMGEPEIRVTAIQIVAPLQAMANDPGRFERFSGLGIATEDALDRVIDRLVDNILTEAKEKMP